MKTQKIVSRWGSSRVLFECKVPDEIESGLSMRYALEKAVAQDARLDGASLDGASLVGARLDGARLDGASLVGARLDGASLDGARLGPIRGDFFDILLRAPNEVAGLRAALVEGRVNGSTYTGECACLVSTIANVRHTDYQRLGNGIKPDSGRPAEIWFMAIRKGDTPETNQVSAITVAWVDEFLGLMAGIRGEVSA